MKKNFFSLEFFERYLVKSLAELKGNDGDTRIQHLLKCDMGMFRQISCDGKRIMQCFQ